MVAEVVFAEEARDDLRKIHEYYLQFSDSTADAALDDIFALTETLELFPFSGRLLDNGARRRSTRRYKFSLTYISDSETVEILYIHRYQNRS